MQIAIYKKEKVMTVAEVAKAMGVSKDTIKNCIRRISPNKMQHGKQTFLNEEEIACISKELKNNGYFKAKSTDETVSSVENSVTKLELLADYQRISEKVITYLKTENEQLATEKEQLKIQLDESKEWYSIKRMQKLNPDEDFSYSLLKKESVKLGYSIKKVFDANYGEVNSYHRDVWESLYSDTINYGD